MNQTSDYQFTIIVPIYNEEDNIAGLESRLSAFLTEASVSTCVLFVDDHSSDSSLVRVKEICARHKAFFYIALSVNGGLSSALKAGFDVVGSPLTGYMDADLQTAPEDFNMLLASAGEYELVTGIRADRKDSGFKKLQSRIANGFRRIMTGDGVRDTGCPLKVIHTDMARRMPFFSGMHRFLPAMVLMMGGRVMQMPVRHFPRVAGVSKYNIWNRLKGPFIDCFAYRWMRNRYIDYHVSDENISFPTEREQR